VFYGLVRSGFNHRRLNHTAVTQAQCLFGVLCATTAYSVHGPTRGAVLVIVLVILVFGMFALRPIEARRIGLFSLAMLGIVMAWGSWVGVAGRDYSVELVHFLFASVGVVTVLVLSERLGTMRVTLVAQKHQLEDLLERLQELATRDELTGLFNRRHMMTRLDDELSRLDRHHGALAVVLLDIDHFKQVNDRHGHRVGDAVLRAFAKLAGEALRQTDIVARWGGEEFLLLLPMTPDAVAVSAIDRIRVALRDQPVSVAQPRLRVTFSAGLAMARPGDSIENLVERADHAMYRAKQGGRDRTVIDDSTDSLADGP
jgi:diguanylate cyclase (GGDEF)-like protein